MAASARSGMASRRRLARDPESGHRFPSRQTRNASGGGLRRNNMRRIVCPSATTGGRPPTAASTSTPSTANATGTSVPITPSRSTRSSAASRRRPPRSTRCASSSSAARSVDERYLRALEDPGGVLDADRRELAARRPQPLRPARPALRRTVVLQSCWNTTPIRRPRSSRPRCFNGPGSNRRSNGASFRRAPTSSTRIHERLIEAWKEIAAGRHLHLSGTTGNEEDAGTLRLSRGHRAPGGPLRPR